MVSKNTNLTSQDWLLVALNVFSDEGIEKVKVEPLARRLGVTKGSFYWHFRDRQDLLSKMIDYWESAQTEIIAHLGNSALDPHASLWDLLQFTSRKDSRHDVAVRSWARHDKQAANAIRKIDSLRMAFCETLFTQMGFSGAQAKLRARMVYFYQVGEYTVLNPDSQQVRMELAALRYKLLITKTDEVPE